MNKAATRMVMTNLDGDRVELNISKDAYLALKKLMSEDLKPTELYSQANTEDKKRLVKYVQEFLGM